MKKKRLLVQGTRLGIEKAEKALLRLGFGTRANFAEVKYLSRTTITKFFKLQPIQFDKFETICEELDLNWREIIDLSEEANNCLSNSQSELSSLPRKPQHLQLAQEAGFIGFQHSWMDEVRRVAIRGDVVALRQLAAVYGGAAIRLNDGYIDDLTTLHWAAGSGVVEAVKWLLASPVEADVRASRGNNFTPLHAAAMKGHAEVCDVLLQAGADVNIQTLPQRYAPLHSAAFAGHLQAVKVLLAYGANLELRNYRNERPVDTAQRQTQFGVVKFLEEMVNTNSSGTEI